MRRLEATTLTPTTTSTSMLDNTSNKFSCTDTNKLPSLKRWTLKPTTIRSTAVHLHYKAAKTTLHITVKRVGPTTAATQWRAQYGCHGCRGTHK
uniref:Uncharacterized protein n=1 Tax=Trichogramma kaykai TaxID=54128 RepID=A0ABD2XC41_9HYME